MCKDIYKVEIETKKGLLVLFYDTLKGANKWIFADKAIITDGVTIGKDATGDDVKITTVLMHTEES
mgnify:CR=1 FL=1